LPDLVAQLLFRCHGWFLITRTRPIKKMTVFSISHRSIGIAVVLSLTVVSSLKAQGPTNPTVPVKSSYQFPVAEEEFRASHGTCEFGSRVL
jgi:hypothetical protein